MGVAAAQMERKGIVTEKGEIKDAGYIIVSQAIKRVKLCNA